MIVYACVQKCEVDKGKEITYTIPGNCVGIAGRNTAVYMYQVQETVSKPRKYDAGSFAVT